MEVVLDVKNDMLDCFSKSKLITYKEVAEQKLSTKIVAYLFKIFEPLL